METVSQVLTGINDPKQSFYTEAKCAFDALSELSPQTLEMTLRSLLWVGAHIAIDQPSALGRTVEMVKNAITLTPIEREVFITQLSNELFRE